MNTNDTASVVLRRAEFSPCSRYRYSLERRWCARTRRAASITFIGLNPSTADATVDDPTIRRCMGFATRWGFERLFVVNLFGYRSPWPAELGKVADPIGPENDAALARCVRRSQRVVVCWGEHGAWQSRSFEVLENLHRQLYCLGYNHSGQPVHPLYRPAATPLQRFRAPDQLSAVRRGRQK